MKFTLFVWLALLALSCKKNTDEPKEPLQLSINGRWAFAEKTTRFVDIANNGTAITFPEPVPMPLSGSVEPVTIAYTVSVSGDTLKLKTSRYPGFYFYRVGDVVKGFEQDLYHGLSAWDYNEIIRQP